MGPIRRNYEGKLRNAEKLNEKKIIRRKNEKIIILVTVLALIAALVVPMAVSADPISSSGTVTVQGEMVAPTITLTAPGPFDFGQFAEGLNAANSQAGYVQFAPGSDQFATWALSATSTAPYTAGEMYCSALNNFLSTQMAVSLDGSNYAYLSGGVTTAPSTSANSTFYLYAHQNVTQADILVGSGTYSIVVNLMATVTP